MVLRASAALTAAVD